MYTVKQVANKLQLSEHTIRYYDRQGLMPFVIKEATGKRLFTETDLELIELIMCLKTSGMPLSEIKKLMTYIIANHDTTQLQRDILNKHKQFIENQMKQLQQSLCSIDYKLTHCLKKST